MGSALYRITSRLCQLCFFILALNIIIRAQFVIPPHFIAANFYIWGSLIFTLHPTRPTPRHQFISIQIGLLDEMHLRERHLLLESSSKWSKKPRDIAFISSFSVIKGRVCHFLRTSCNVVNMLKVWKKKFRRVFIKMNHWQFRTFPTLAKFLAG